MAWCQHLSVVDSSFELDRLPALAKAGKRQRSSPETRNSTAAKQSKYGDAGSRVLLLGRIQELAMYRAEVLRDRGFEVRTSTDREEALKLIRRGDFDAVVLSYTLSSDMVEELADEIRENCPQCPLVVIARSLKLDRKVAPDAVALADDGPKALISALRRVLQRH